MYDSFHVVVLFLDGQFNMVGIHTLYPEKSNVTERTTNKNEINMQNLINTCMGTTYMDYFDL